MAKVLENPNPKIYPKLEDKLGADEHSSSLKPGHFDARGIFGTCIFCLSDFFFTKSATLAYQCLHNFFLSRAATTH